MFNQELTDKTNDYIIGKISLNAYKAWLFPMSWYLELPADHPVNDIKHLLAEHSYENSGITESKLKDGMTKILILKSDQLK